MLRKNTDVSIQSPALQYLSLVSARLAAIRKDVPKLVKMGEKMAELLIEGGEIFTPDVAPFWPSEFCDRAGGMMGVRKGMEWAKSSKNFAYFAVPNPKTWRPKEDKKFKELIDSKAKLFVVGRPEDLAGAAPASRFAGFTGGADPDAGLYGTPERRPLAGLREFEQFVRAWITAGEMIAACTRAGKIPIIWMSVWLEGALVRNGHFFLHDNLHEPWHTPVFHDKHYVPPMDAGYVSGAFLDEAERIHRRLIDQAGELATAGQWLAQAKKNGRRIWTVAVGHSYPVLLELPSDPDAYPMRWGPSFSDLKIAVPAEYKDGDVALHFGYAPVDNADVKLLLKRGLRLIHTSPYGNSVSPVKDKNFLYFDLPWRPADATVDVPGYSVRILPMSSTAQSMSLFAIMAEMAERMGWS